MHRKHFVIGMAMQDVGQRMCAAVAMRIVLSIVESAYQNTIFGKHYRSSFLQWRLWHLFSRFGGILLSARCSIDGGSHYKSSVVDTAIFIKNIGIT